jgi:hypothetical protein
MMLVMLAASSLVLTIWVINLENRVRALVHRNRLIERRLLEIEEKYRAEFELGKPGGFG